MKKLFYSAISCIAMVVSTLSYAGDYPETRDEKRAKEIGSVLGGDGLVFRPGKVRNTSTKTDDGNVNKYLWQASQDIVEDLAPIASADAETGTLVTEWYSNSKDPKRSFKLKLHVVGDVISPESIKTELKQRVLKDGRWLEDKAPSNLQTSVEDKILRRARQLYLRKSAK